MANFYQSPSQRGRSSTAAPGAKSTMNTSQSYVQTKPLKLEEPERDLFSVQAENWANICQSIGEKNNSTQIRRFYDELVLLSDTVKTAQSQKEKEAEFHKVEPYIQMIRAKAAYAKGRNLIDEKFKKLIDELIEQIKTPASLENGKLFFEAFLGFKKYEENK